MGIINYKKRYKAHALLDHILNSIKDLGHDKPLKYFEIFYYSKLELTNRDQKIIEEKLLKDGFLEKIKVVTETPNYDGYHITFLGLLFIEKGGYKNQLVLLKFESFLKWLTLIIVPVGTIIAIIYSIYMIFLKDNIFYVHLLK